MPTSGRALDYRAVHYKVGAGRGKGGVASFGGEGEAPEVPFVDAVTGDSLDKPYMRVERPKCLNIFSDEIFWAAAAVTNSKLSIARIVDVHRDADGGASFDVIYEPDVSLPKFFGKQPFSCETLVSRIGRAIAAMMPAIIHHAPALNVPVAFMNS